MTSDILETESDEVLVALFTASALKQHKAATNAEHDRPEDFERLNRHILHGWTVRDELKRRGSGSLLRLIALYEHPNVQVRLNAAAATMFISPDKARPVLQEIIHYEGFPEKVEAKEMLAALERGHFQVPR